MGQFRISFIFFVTLVVLMSLICKSFRMPSRVIGARREEKTLSLLRMCVTSPYTKSGMQNVSVEGSSSFEYAGDVLVIPFYKPTAQNKADDTVLISQLKIETPDQLPKSIKDIVFNILDDGNFKADSNSKLVTRIFDSTQSIKYVALVGLGVDPKKEPIDMEVTSANKLGKSVAAISKEVNAKSLGIVMPKGFANPGMSQLFLGLHDALYVDNRFKKMPEGGHKRASLSNIHMLGLSESISKSVELNYKLTEIIAQGVDFAKDLVGAPPNCKTPTVIADLAREMSADHKLECRILGEKECKEMKMGGYLGVQQGSNQPPQFIHLTYKPENPTSPYAVTKVALVGKGLTFDSGGYNLKAGPGSMIELMKFDMGGCAAVLGCAKAIAQLRPKNLEVHFITAVCENMISAEAMKPGDILTASNGKTIEVLNTDAEGRLTLADALVYADNLKVDSIIDLATLTGACIVGLGEKLAGLYSSDPQLQADLESAAKRMDEGLWTLPLEPSYKELIKSSLADLKNIGGKGGGSITAALFLQEFVENSKWAHIDMAGPVWDTSASKPTGFGVKLLVDYLLNIKPKK